MLEIIGVTALFTLFTPEIAAPDFEPRSVEVVEHGEDVEMRALNSSGEVVGTIAAWSDVDGIHVVADYGDGWAETLIDDGAVVSHEATLPSAVLEGRAEAIGDLVYAGPPDSQAGASWVECGAYLALAGGACAMGHVVGCAGYGVLAYCGCAEKFEKLPDCV